MDENMYCPVDQSRLHEKLVEGLSSHRCQLCHGIFIPGDFFRQVKAQAALQVHREIAGNTPNLNTPRLCPKRCSTMMLMHIKGIEIDVCPHCDGIWLDSGELEKMILQFGLPKKHVLEKLDNKLATIESMQLKPVKTRKSNLDSVNAIDVIDLASGLFNFFN
jgi:Zn-finger nucleic acid-binding protein